MKEMINFTNETQVCYLATIDEGSPRVRALGFWFADETGFYFQTGSMKDMYKQLSKNRKVEVCFFKPGEGTGMMLRISGEIEFVDDKKLKERCMADRPFLKNFGLTAESPELIIFRMSHGQAHFWTMESNLKPKEMIEF